MSSPNLQLPRLLRLASAAPKTQWQQGGNAYTVADRHVERLALCSTPEMAAYILAVQPRIVRGLIDEIKSLRRQLRAMQRSDKEAT